LDDTYVYFCINKYANDETQFAGLVSPDLIYDDWSADTGPGSPVVSIYGVSVPEINLTGNGADIDSGDATPSCAQYTQFGSALVSSGTTTRTFTVENLGTAALTISSVTTGGANVSDFQATTSPASSVASAGSTTFVMTFNSLRLPGFRRLRKRVPVGLGGWTLNCSVTGVPFIVEEGVTAPEIDVRGNSVSIEDGDDAPVMADHTHFGSVEIVFGSRARTYTILNTGNAALTILGVGISVTDASDFSVTTAPASTVAASASTTFVVTFAPAAVGRKSAAITITNGQLPGNGGGIYNTGVLSIPSEQTIGSNGLPPYWPPERFLE
jgi:hypothetical protein